MRGVLWSRSVQAGVAEGRRRRAVLERGLHPSSTGIGSSDPSTVAAQLESDQASAAGSFTFSVAGADDVSGDGYTNVS